MKTIRVLLKPTGFKQMLSDMEPGAFVYLDAFSKPIGLGIKTEYGPKHDSYNEAGEHCGEGPVMPVEMCLEEEEI